jgi:hypothetical protein
MEDDDRPTFADSSVEEPSSISPQVPFGRTMVVDRESGCHFARSIITDRIRRFSA